MIDIYGIAQDPITKEYIFVMEYTKDESLQDYLVKDFKNLKWINKIGILYDVIGGLEQIHQQKFIHHLHSGNILYHKGSFISAYITDLGLSCPADQTLNENENHL